MKRVLRFLASYGILVALAGLALFLALTRPETFPTGGNLANILRQNAFTAVLAVGVTLTILTGGIDLSVGSVVALSGVLCADALAHGHGVLAGVLVGIALGAVVGLANGALVTRLRIPPFIVTLAMMLVVRGAALKYTKARNIQIPEPVSSAFATLSNGLTPAVLMLAVVVLAWLLLVRTAFGRHVYAVGGNVEAARLSGLRVERILVSVYVLCGALAGLAGVMLASRLNSGDFNAGQFSELDAVAAAVVGGTSLFGGRGSVWGTLAGVLFIGTLNNGLNLYEVQEYDQKIVKGLVLLAATSLDLWRGREPT
jgi:ribose/xylose/arabinose/galactoside ABC-type transport system permease subunit